MLNGREAAKRAQELRPLLNELAEAGISSTRLIAAELNRRGIKSPPGKSWHQTSVARLLNRQCATATW
jgi:hypothetical protein